jgi:hypothetical protein
MEEFRHVPVPERLVAENGEVLSLLDAGQRLRRDRAGILRARAIQRMELRDGMRAIQTHVAAVAETEGEERYRAALDELVATSERAEDDRRRENGRALSGLVKAHAALRAPDAFRHAHELTCRAFHEQLAAMWEYYGALREADRDGVSIAAQRYEETAQVCAERLLALGVQIERIAVVDRERESRGP